MVPGRQQVAEVERGQLRVDLTAEDRRQLRVPEVVGPADRCHRGQAETRHLSSLEGARGDQGRVGTLREAGHPDAATQPQVPGGGELAGCVEEVDRGRDLRPAVEVRRVALADSEADVVRGCDGVPGGGEAQGARLLVGVAFADRRCVGGGRRGAVLEEDLAEPVRARGRVGEQPTRPDRSTTSVDGAVHEAVAIDRTAYLFSRVARVGEQVPGRRDVEVTDPGC